MIVVLILFMLCKVELACLSGNNGDRYVLKLGQDTKKIHARDDKAVNLKSNAALVYSGERLLGKLDSETKEYNQEKDEVFDLESGAAIQLALRYIDKSIRERICRDGSDFSIIIHLLVYFSIAMFDSIAPYDRFTVQILSNIIRRPAAEGYISEKSRNKAILFTTYHVGVGLIPNSESIFRLMLKEAQINDSDINYGLNISDSTTPEGIGKIVAENIINTAKVDGMNIVGDIENNSPYLRPYSDYTGYTPRNQAESIISPCCWQPDSLKRDNSYGAYVSQQFITPQLRNVKPFAFKKDINDIVIEPPGRLDEKNILYNRTTESVLKSSASLSEKQRGVCKTFEDKLNVFTTVLMHTWESQLMTQQEAVHFFASLAIASMDNYIAVWKQKYYFDSVRPFTAIKYLFKERLVRVHDGSKWIEISGKTWKSYLQAPNYPEYPSATASFCSVLAEVSRKWLSSGDTIGPKTTKIQHQSSNNEYLLVPQVSLLRFHANKIGQYQLKPMLNDTEEILSQYSTWSEFEKECALSRVWGGVNFNDTITVSKDFGRQFVEDAIDFVRGKIDEGIERVSEDNYYYGKTLWPKNYGLT